AEKDFVPVAGYGTIPTALLVNPSVPVNSVSDLIALAKKKPGAVTFGTAGVGSALHIAGLELESLTGIKMTAVHYRGAAPALSDVIAGHIKHGDYGAIRGAEFSEARKAQDARLRQREAGAAVP